MQGPPTPSAEDRPASDGTTGDRDGRFFVGREAEMGALQRGLGDVVSGRGRLLLLGGEPGIGKTRSPTSSRPQPRPGRAGAVGPLLGGGRRARVLAADPIRPGAGHDLDAEALAAAVRGGGPDIVQALRERNDMLEAHRDSGITQALREREQTGQSPPAP